MNLKLLCKLRHDWSTFKAIKDVRGESVICLRCGKIR